MVITCLFDWILNKLYLEHVINMCVHTYNYSTGVDNFKYLV